MEYRDRFQEYARLMREIRLLSTPGLSDIESGEDYSKVLLSNFRTIGKMAETNRIVVDDVLMPLLKKEEKLSDGERSALSELTDMLVDADYGEDADGPLPAVEECGDGADPRQGAFRIKPHSHISG